MAVKQWKNIERNTDLAKGGDTIDLTRTVGLNGNGKSSCCNGNRDTSNRSMQHEILQ